jgi:hypothetical protein
MRSLEIRENLSFPTAVVQGDALQEFLDTSASNPDEAKLLINASKLLLSRTYYNDPKEQIGWYAEHGKRTYIGPDGTPTREPDESVEGEFSLIYRGLRAKSRDDALNEVDPHWRERRNAADTAQHAAAFYFDFGWSEVARQSRAAQPSSSRAAVCLISNWQFSANNNVVSLRLEPSDSIPNTYTGILQNFATIHTDY